LTEQDTRRHTCRLAAKVRDQRRGGGSCQVAAAERHRCQTVRQGWGPAVAGAGRVPPTSRVIGHTVGGAAYRAFEGGCHNRASRSDLNGALAAYRGGMTIAERLAASDRNADWQRDLSVSHNQIGDALRPGRTERRIGSLLRRHNQS